MTTIDELRKEDSYSYKSEYKEVCKNCNTEVTVYSQDNEGYSEYVTQVAVPCPKCGHYVKFNLPVN